jgi:DNA-binding NtrC family response regulator
LETTDKIGLSSIIMEPPNALFRAWGSPIDPTDSSQPSETQTSNKIKDFSLEKAERKLITRALQETGWQKTRAAALLGITRATLYAKVKQYNIEKGIYLVKETADESQSPLSPETVTTN